MNENDERSPRLVAECESGGKVETKVEILQRSDFLLVLSYLTQQAEVGEGQLQCTVSSSS